MRSRGRHTLQLSIQLHFELGNRSPSCFTLTAKTDFTPVTSFLSRCLIDDAESFAQAGTDVGRYLYFITWEDHSLSLSLFPSFEITPGIEELISHRGRVDSLVKILVFLFSSARPADVTIKTFRFMERQRIV